MATRSGDLDPAILSYLARAEHLTPDQVEHLLNYDSGLLGVSGLSKDMRELEQAAPSDEAAELALAMFSYRARKYIGAYLAALGRVDAIIFGGGIGEHSAAMRARICDGLEALGIEFDRAGNAAANSGERCFSTGGSSIALWVIPLNEELYIARAAAHLLVSTPPPDRISFYLLSYWSLPCRIFLPHAPRWAPPSPSTSSSPAWASRCRS